MVAGSDDDAVVASVQVLCHVLRPGVADLTFPISICRESFIGTSNPKPHWNHRVASVPSVPTLVNGRAAKGYKRRNRDTGGYVTALTLAVPKLRHNAHGRAPSSAETLGE